MNRRYSFLLGSDIQRDGVYLELVEVETDEAVAEVFYSDATGEFTMSIFRDSIPLEAVEELIASARKRLPRT
jgi:hypothetical protein